MTLTDKDIETIKRLGFSKKVQFSFGEYWIKKPVTFFDAICELIMHEVSLDFGFLIPDYFLVSLKGEIYVLSTDLNRLGDFKTAEDLELYEDDKASLYNIWAALKKQFGHCPDLMFNVMKMFIMDVLFYNSDRVASNWGILFKDDSRQIAIIDNEMILDKETPMIMSSYLNQGEYNEKRSYLDNDALLQDNLRNFLQELQPISLLKTFEYYYQKMTPEYFQKVLTKVGASSQILTENGYIPLENPYEEEMLELYLQNYEIIKEVWETLKNGRK